MSMVLLPFWSRVVDSRADRILCKVRRDRSAGLKWVRFAKSTEVVVATVHIVHADERMDPGPGNAKHAKLVS
jgi:transcriptional regulator NrdR family protein